MDEELKTLINKNNLLLERFLERQNFLLEKLLSLLDNKTELTYAVYRKGICVGKTHLFYPQYWDESLQGFLIQDKEIEYEPV